MRSCPGLMPPDDCPAEARLPILRRARAQSILWRSRKTSQSQPLLTSVRFTAPMSVIGATPRAGARFKLAVTVEVQTCHMRRTGMRNSAARYSAVDRASSRLAAGRGTPPRARQDDDPVETGRQWDACRGFTPGSLLRAGLQMCCVARPSARCLEVAINFADQDRKTDERRVLHSRILRHRHTAIRANVSAAASTGRWHFGQRSR